MATVIQYLHKNTHYGDQFKTTLLYDYKQFQAVKFQGVPNNIRER